MAQTKARTKVAEPPPRAAAPVPVVEERADDQTPLDESAKRKAEELPDGFTKRLPAGPERVVRIDPKAIKKGTPPVEVFEVNAVGDTVEKGTRHNRIRIEGASEIVHVPGDKVCGSKASVRVRTRAAILVD